MKYRIICVVVVGALLLSTTLFPEIKVKRNRYHQHLEAKPKAECTTHGDDVFCTHLPLINITTDGEIPEPYVLEDGQELPYEDIVLGLIHIKKNDEMVSATIEYYDNENQNNHLIDKPVVKEKALIRTRGATSRIYDKKGYLIKFKEDDLITNKKVSLSDMTADDEWVLHGPFLDKTLIRNYICYNLAGEIMEYAPNVRFCEAYLNGEYIGLYLLVEKVGYNKNGRIQISKTDPDIAETSYIVKIDRQNSDPLESISTFSRESLFSSSLSSNTGYMSIVYPALTLTEEQRRYIISDVSKFEKAIYSFDYDDKKRGYVKYIDVESFVDYFLINEFTLNYDAGALSRFFYKDVGGKYKMCVWDFNSAFDYYKYSYTTPQTFILHKSIWYEYLFKDETFVEAIVERYYELSEDYFNEEYLFSYIDETIEYLGSAIDRNYEKWGYSFQSVYNGKLYDFIYPTERNVRNYEGAVEQLKDCLSNRIKFMNENIGRLGSLSHDSINKKYNYQNREEKQ